jgi:two-component system, cell cycle sensor histidine kinase and response regulator CckA
MARQFPMSGHLPHVALVPDTAQVTVECSLLYGGVIMGEIDTSSRGGILVIDDDTELLDVVRYSLEPAGFHVCTASTAAAGVEVYEKNWRDIKLVLLDYLMPEMTGDLIFDCLKRQNPDVRTILLTGCDDRVAKPMFQVGLFGYLHKPFALEDLVERVRQAVDSI